MKENVLTKDKTEIVYGVAILLMVFHHLFGFPQRISYDYVQVLEIGSLHIETVIAHLGKICVSMYAFISGYGFTKKTNDVEKTYPIVWKQIKKFYMHYWLVFVSFVPYGMIRGLLIIELKDVIENIFGISSTYNAEWWYVRHYIIMLMIFPIVNRVYECFVKKITTKIRVFLEVLLICIAVFLIDDYYYIFVFVVGVLFAKEEYFEYMYKKTRSNYFIITSLIITLGMRMVYGWKIDIVLTPCFIYVICMISEKNFFKKYVNTIISLFGRYSVYIWLMHTFFVYYYFQSLIFSAKYSLLIYAWTMFLCTLVAYVLDRVLKSLSFELKVMRGRI